MFGSDVLTLSVPCQSQCLVKVGAHVAAAVLYQCLMPEEFKYGLRILRLAPESHGEGFFQYFWEVRLSCWHLACVVFAIALTCVPTHGKMS